MKTTQIINQKQILHFIIPLINEKKKKKNNWLILLRVKNNKVIVLVPLLNWMQSKDYQ